MTSPTLPSRPSGRPVRRHPHRAAQRARAAAALGLALPAEADVLARLREAATVTGRDHVLVLAPENEPYEPLFGAPT